MNKEMKCVDPRLVPAVLLATGDKIPVIGMGTFGSDNYGAEEIAEAVRVAIKMGYRHLDCAAVYGNEKEIGDVLRELFQEGVVKREELWITSKVWNDKHHDVKGACKDSLKKLGLDYLDLYLVHWPFPNHHPPMVDVESRDPHARPYIHKKNAAFDKSTYDL
jgi:alcohol dehydrogenase (NADP+)